MRFTDNARSALAHAEVLARLSQSTMVETSHLLLAIASQKDSAGSNALREVGVDAEKLRIAVDIKPGVVIATSSAPLKFSNAMQLTVRMAVGLSDEFQRDLCGTAHLLFCLLSQRHSRAYKLLADQNIDVENLTLILSDSINDFAVDRLNDDDEEDDNNNMYEQPSHMFGFARSGGQSGQSMLARFGHDLTKQAKEGKLDPVIGRAREIDRLVTIISRRTKNNPVLIGEAGVGKTAVVEGLAERIATGNVPEFLLDKQIIEVDLAAMVAGTTFRGEFEERLKRLINEVEKNDKIIVFIDEVHLLVGAGSAEGTMDAANLLKPALARGKFQLIGATTNDEYRKRIERDAALTRRFQPVRIEAPNAKDTAKILTGLATKYEDYHHVKISEQVIDEIVRLSERYLTDRQQPDKAIDVLDETAARVHVASAESNDAKKLANYQAEIKKLTTSMDKAVSSEDYEHAALFKMRISQLKDKINDIKSKQTESGRINIKLNDVATTISQMTGVPLEQLKRSEITKLVNLEKRLAKRIIGQPQAVTVVAQAIRRSRAGIANPNRPIGSFIFLGPTGVGKTELAKVLADEVFGSKDSLIKVDMSEFSERHTVARLIGAPAGYVGYDDGGQLTEQVRRKPYSVVLFDEIEKAHPSVFNILLQILEDGVLTDGHGKKVDFRNCVIILTSNIGANEMTGQVVGFSLGGDEQTKQSSADNRREIVMRVLKKTMRPELLNRFDQVVMFSSLGDKEISQILDLMLDELNNRLAQKGIALLVSPKLKRWLIAKGTDRQYGARPLRRALQDELERVLADDIIAGKIGRGDIVKADLKQDRVTLIQQAERRSRKTKVAKSTSAAGDQ